MKVQFPSLATAFGCETFSCNFCIVVVQAMDRSVFFSAYGSAVFSAGKSQESILANTRTALVQTVLYAVTILIDITFSAVSQAFLLPLFI